MKRATAHREAHRRWSTPDNAPDDRCGIVVVRQKKVVDRFEVGYYERDGQRVTMGRGRSWEEAFADADRSVTERELLAVARKFANDDAKASDVSAAALRYAAQVLAAIPTDQIATYGLVRQFLVVASWSHPSTLEAESLNRRSCDL